MRPTVAVGIHAARAHIYAARLQNYAISADRLHTFDPFGSHLFIWIDQAFIPSIGLVDCQTGLFTGHFDGQRIYWIRFKRFMNKDGCAAESHLAQLSCARGPVDLTPIQSGHGVDAQFYQCRTFHIR